MASQTRTRFIRVSESSSNSVQAGYPDKGCPAFWRYTGLQQAAHLVFCKHRKLLFLTRANDNKPVFRYSNDASIKLDGCAVGGTGGVRRFSHKLHHKQQTGRYSYLPVFLFLVRTAENRTLCRARALSKREAFVASGRGRRQAAEASADLRSKYADSPRNAPARYRCDADRASCPGLNPSTDSPNRGESNSMQGAAVKKTPWQRRPGHAFPMAAQAESPSRNPASDWDVVSGWRLKRKLRPGIEP